MYSSPSYNFNNSFYPNEAQELADMLHNINIEAPAPFFGLKATASNESDFSMGFGLGKRKRSQDFF